MLLTLKTNFYPYLSRKNNQTLMTTTPQTYFPPLSRLRVVLCRRNPRFWTNSTTPGLHSRPSQTLRNHMKVTKLAPRSTNFFYSSSGSCFSEGREVPHGQPVASESSCVTCNCFYGNIVCQKAPCPVPKPGCRKSSVQDVALCCPLYVCGKNTDKWM